MQRHLIDYIRQPEVIDKQATSRLESMAKEYPFFHAARVLMLQSMHRLHSPRFDEELRKSAVLIPDRQALFHTIEEPNYTQKEERRKYSSQDFEEDRSQREIELIDGFLDKQPLQQPQKGRHRIDATQDYIGYILQNEAATEESKDIPLNGGGVVEDFLNQETQKIQLKDIDDNDYKNTAEETQNNEDNEILTEVMAGIYIKQGKFENAIKIIRQLSLKYPKKNRYFADQIRFLEKLIINNKNK